MRVHRALSLIAGVLLLLLGVLFVQKAAKADPPVTGAIFTTDSTCTGVDLNIYDSKADVYIDGGPAKPGAAGLPDGYYYVQVTDPSGMTVLGTSVGSANPTPVHVTNGDFDTCLKLCAILTCTANCAADDCGYGNTPNAGGEYKVWVSNRPDFKNSSTKTDNFKVKASEIPNPPPASTLIIKKFYDTNMDGIPNDGPGGDPIWIEGWQVNITGTTTPAGVPVNQNVLTTFSDSSYPPGVYDITEGTPTGSSWFHTYSTANGQTTTATTVHISLAAGGSQTVLFGNVCVGAGGGLTLGYWSNKNGANSVNTSTLGASNILAGLNALCLANGTGALGMPHFASYSAYQTWLLSASATNMAYMLSAQMSAMWLNVNAQRNLPPKAIYDTGGKLVGGVDGNALIFVGVGVTGTNVFGFMTVNDLLTAANTSVCNCPKTITSGATRNYQTILKNALDAGNNNANAFVQSGPCPFTF